MAPNLWQIWVPKELCETYREWERHHEPMKSKMRGVLEMFVAIRQAGGLKRTRDRQATGTAVVIPKN